MFSWAPCFKPQQPRQPARTLLMRGHPHPRQAFGGVLLYKWRSDDVTKLQPPPHYILLLLLFGGLLFAANALAFAGACYRTRCMLGAATCINFALLLAQLSLAIVIFADPSAIDQQVACHSPSHLLIANAPPCRYTPFFNAMLLQRL